MPISKPPSGLGRVMGLVHAALVLVILALSASIALVTSPPAPPTTAQLAPGSRQIEGPDDATESPEPTAEADNPYAGIDRSRVRRCVGDPPRQTEDPMSPPCVPYWDGEDNGGATAQGVTETQINVVMPGGIHQIVKGVAGLVAHFNERYEFYGRELNVQFLQTEEFLSQLNPAQYAAYAEEIDTEMNAFAVMSPSDSAMGTATTLYDMLAERGIISVDVGAGTRSAAELNEGPNALYQWSFFEPDDVLQQHFVEWACGNLVGQPAIHAGDDLDDDPRRFGVLVQRNPAGASFDPSVLLAGLEACDADLVEPQELTFEFGASEIAGAETTLARLRSQGVTSLACVCGNHFIGRMMIAAEELGWHPEWVSTGIGSQASDANLAPFWPPEQLSHFFGLAPATKAIPLPDRPWFAAAREGDPTITPAYGREQQSNWGRSVEQLYLSLLIIASGIQGAGPNLTPETFAAALQSTEFPNPGAAGPPLYQPRAGFGVGDHAFIEDVSLTYWDPTVRPYDDPQLGTYCYVNGGARYRLGEWPTDTVAKFYPEGRPDDVSCW